MSALPGTPPYLFAQSGSHPAPFEFDVPASLEVQPTAATATFDGTNASGVFLACLSFYAQSGQLLSRVFPTTQVAAGDVAQVSYAPFPGGLTSKDNPNAQSVLDYAQITTNVSVTSTDPMSPDNIITGNAVSYNGIATVLVTFFTPILQVNGAGFVRLQVFDGTNYIGVIAHLGVASGGVQIAAACAASVRYVPTAGTYAHSITGYCSTTTGQVYAGTVAFHPTSVVPAYLLITTP